MIILAVIGHWSMVIIFFVRADLFSFSSNNALLEFLLDSSPGVQEQLRDSRKEVSDIEIKATISEHFLMYFPRLIGG